MKPNKHARKLARKILDIMFELASGGVQQPRFVVLRRRLEYYAKALDLEMGRPVSTNELNDIAVYVDH